MTRDDSIDLASAKRRLLREAGAAERDAQDRIRRASTGMHVASVAVGLMMGHRGTRRFAMSAADAVTEAAKWFRSR